MTCPGDESGLSVLDLSLFSTFRDNIKQGNYSGIGAILTWDRVHGDAATLVTFLHDHDVGPDNDFKYRFQGNTWMTAIAYDMPWFMRGSPCLHHGEETECQRSCPAWHILPPWAVTPSPSSAWAC